MGIPIGGGGGGDPQDPGLTCAEAKAQIASLTMTVANLQNLLAHTTDPVQRNDIQQGIGIAQQELAVLRSELPLICAPPPPKPAIPVLIVLDGTDASFQNVPGNPDNLDEYFTISYFQSVLETQGVTTPLLPLAITRAHRQVDPGTASSMPSIINNAYFTWKSSTLPPGVTGKSVMDLSVYQVVFLFGFQPFSSLDVGLAWDGDGNPGQEQLWAIAAFMNNGGGLFATGDHEDLGAPLCAAIPRVRSMRRWLWKAGDNAFPQNDDGAGFFDEGGEEVNPVTVDPSQPSGFSGYDANFANNVELIHPHNTSQAAQLGMKCAPPALGALRNDTLQPNAQDVTLADLNAKQKVEQPGQSVPGAISLPFIPFDRQSDDVPQPVTLASSVIAQQLFTLPSGGLLTAYPDHMHEGMAIDLSDTTNPDPRTVTYLHQGVTIQEYPSTASAGQPVPQVLMTLKTTAGHATPSGQTFHGGAWDKTGASVQFGGVSAYDGQPVGVGRIVTDSTFHHFVDINIIGDPGNTTPNTNPSPANPDHGVVPLYARNGFNSSATGQSYLAQFAQYWLNLVNWLLPPTAAAPLLMAAVDHARTSVSVRMTAGPGVAAHGEAVHGLGEIVTQLIDRHLPIPLLRDVVHHAMSAAHAQGVADWLASTRTGQPDVADAVDRVLLHGFMGGAVLHGLGLPREQNLAADAETVARDVVHAGLRGAAKALTASKHSGIAGDLIGLLAGTVLA